MQDGFDAYFDTNTPDEESIRIGKYIMNSRSVFYTAPVMNTPKKIKEELHSHRHDLFRSLYDVNKKITGEDSQYFSIDRFLILIDEADRLQLKSLEQVRAMYDENDWAIVLIGMPGIEKRLARYPTGDAAETLTLDPLQIHLE